MADIDKLTEKQLRNLGNRLRELRKEKGYSNYEQFAFENGIPRAQYGRYEKGENLRFSTLAKIINAHRMTMAEFFSEGFD